MNNSNGLALTAATLATKAAVSSGAGATLVSVSGSSATVAVVSTTALTSMTVVAAPFVVAGLVGWLIYKSSES